MSTIGVDFDGVLHESPDYTPVDMKVDVTLIHELHKAGHAVAVITANNVSRVGNSLRTAGIRVLVDSNCQNGSWNGGKDGKLVLVTNRKIAATAYVDDRALRWVFGDPVAKVITELKYRASWKVCAKERHWGPYGAAGILPYVVTGGRVHVLVGKRSWKVSQPGTWGGFGGALERRETAWQGAVRELGEEVTIGLNAETDFHAVRATYKHKCLCCGWEYTTFLVELDDSQGIPAVQIADKNETTYITWDDALQVPFRDLHPGFKPAWPEFMTFFNGAYPECTTPLPKPKKTKKARQAGLWDDWKQPLFRSPVDTSGSYTEHPSLDTRLDAEEPDYWSLHGYDGFADDDERAGDGPTEQGVYDDDLYDHYEGVDGQALMDAIKRDFGVTFPPDLDPDDIRAYLETHPDAWYK